MLMLSLGPAAHAAETPAAPKPAFGMASAMHAQQPRETSYVTAVMDSAWSILIFEQHRLTENMIGTVRNLKSTTNVAEAAGALVIASFIYGILHAVGPGHGKAVISSYMLADKETLRRGIFLAFLSSLIQALSAITLIGGLYVAAVATGMQTKWAEAWLETLSWGFVAVIGAWLLFKQLWPMIAHRVATKPRDHSGHAHTNSELFHSHTLHAHDEGHHRRHDHRAHALAAAATPRGLESNTVSNHDHFHDHGDGHDHDHVHDEHCGHVHLPGPDELRGKLSWSRALAISLSIGIRPCTGALLVIIFAATQGLIWAGILATFAMSLGTALTVSFLAALSVGSRKLAIAVAGAESRCGNIVARSASIVSSAAVFVLGTAFFFASFHDVRPF